MCGALTAPGETAQTEVCTLAIGNLSLSLSISLSLSLRLLWMSGVFLC